MTDAHLRVFRGSPGETGRYDEFDVPVEEGMVVLDAVHWIQGHGAPDLAVRWNCKAAKCGSCSAEVDGRPSPGVQDAAVGLRPGRADHGRADALLPLIRDPVTDVSWNYEVNPDDRAVQPRPRHAGRGLALAAGGHRAGPGVPEVHRVLLCQTPGHVLRNHETERAVPRSAGCYGPRRRPRAPPG